VAKKAGRKQPPVVDEADVEEIAQRVLNAMNQPGAEAELMADIARQAATLSNLGKGYSKEYLQELARKVYQRVLWARRAI
jgi:hypothetical protein